MNDVTEFAVLTPLGRGAVAVLALRGTGVTETLGRYFHPASGKSIAQCIPRRIYYGRWQRDADQPAEDVVLTRLDTHWELCCHGGSAAVTAICNDLASQGAVQHAATDWNNRSSVDQVQIQALNAATQARTPQAALTLLCQPEQWQLERASWSALTNQQRVERQKTLATTARWARHLTTPWRIVLAGPPNAGKSSLLNAIVGYERAIVFDQPGTTRDVVTAITAYQGWLWEICDTAGLRTDAEQLEAAGIEFTKRELARADVRLLIFDLTQPLDQLSLDLINSYPDSLIVWNKQDLCSNLTESIVQANRALFAARECVEVSAAHGTGLQQLLAAIYQRLDVPAWSEIAACQFAEELLTVDELQ
jgi:tRNA modification GTPase